eukprot:CAMPEP_0197845252 /NCGR_PEP_ID=MMETSP1438-20131217/2190_1 /TAXON_ID=1461541 /ORGANISM="Pterosperma sp., Strain CCMP1384" /LENGTH=198 /DNA_ID=CAMNT_0043456451 /DNA_START=116 /DNA_END=712 /DNA_ORIENTATION=-
MSSLEEQLKDAVKAKGAARRGNLKNFNTILMKFPKIEAGFSDCKDVFKAIDDDNSNSIELSEMKAATQKLGLSFSEDKMEQIFNLADFDSDKHITFREFIVALTMLHLLSGVEFSATNEQHPTFVQAVEVVVDAFVFFDKNGDGTIQHEELNEAMAGNASNQEIAARFKEMDFKNSGVIQFIQFLYVFEDWVGMDEDE